MKKIILLFIMLMAVMSYAQEKVLDKIELKNGKVYLGKVEKVKTDVVEFTENETDLIYEMDKKDIRYIELANGKVLTFFEDEVNTDQENNTFSENSEIIEEIDSTNAESTILIGFNAGYAFTNMTDVNKDLKDSQKLLSTAGLSAQNPDDISGGLFLEGNLKYSLGQFNIGITGNYISAFGEFNYSDYEGSFIESYDGNTIEALGLFETVFRIKNSSTQFFIHLAGGVGFASVKHIGDFKLFNNPSQNIKVINDVSGNYFAGRIKGGVQFDLKKVILELGLGYRIANAGELKGTHTENGVKYTDKPVRDINGNAISFDYSGFLIAAGITIKL